MLPNEILGGFSTGSDRLAARLLVSFFLIFLIHKSKKKQKGRTLDYEKKKFKQFCYDFEK